jgi:hypothetical protein
MKSDKELLEIMNQLGSYRGGTRRQTRKAIR